MTTATRVQIATHEEEQKTWGLGKSQTAGNFMLTAGSIGGRNRGAVRWQGGAQAELRPACWGRNNTQWRRDHRRVGGGGGKGGGVG